MQELIVNKALLTVLIALVSAQVLKVLTVLISERTLKVSRLRGTGGMPSSHSAAVTALATAVGMTEGLGSPEFAIATVLAVVVMYDACGIRRAAGEHAKLINELTSQLESLFKDGFEPKTLGTLLGHTLPQVFFGGLLGILIALLMYL